MTETPKTPEDGVADALQDLTAQTRNLARREIGAAMTEMWAKARQSLPVAALAATSGALGLLAVASSYRLSLRVLEKRLSPAGAALAATIGYGAAAVGAAVLAARQMRGLPVPFPVDTTRQAGDVLAGAARQVNPAAGAADPSPRSVPASPDPPLR